MSARKTALLNLRIDPAVKEALRLAAAHDHRSVANLIEVLVRQHCATAGIAIPDKGRLCGEDKE